MVLESVLQFSSVAQLCPNLCDPMNRTTPGLPVHHKLPEFIQTQVSLKENSGHGGFPSFLLSWIHSFNRYFWGPSTCQELSSALGYFSQQSGRGCLPAALCFNQWIAFPSVLTSNRREIAQNKYGQLELSALRTRVLCQDSVVSPFPSCTFRH